MPAAKAKSSLLRFDTLADAMFVPDGYGRLQWLSIASVNSARSEQELGVTGYTTGLVSGENVAFASALGGTISSGSAADFEVKSVYVTAAWRDGMAVTFRGFDDGVQRHTLTVLVDDETPTFVRLNFTNVDTVTIESTGGTPSNPARPNYQVVLDDLRVMTSLGSISGTVFDDRNGNGRQNANDGVLGNRLVYLDADGDGVRDAGERSTRTAADGSYSFASLALGEYDVSVDPGRGRAATNNLVDHYRYDFAAGNFNDRYGGTVALVTPRNGVGEIDEDDGWYTLELRSPIELFGNSYSTLYVSVNGVIEFEDPSALTSTNNALPDATRGPIIAPFWADLIFQDGGVMLVEEIAATGKIVAVWANVQYFQQETPTRSSFSVEIDRDGTIAFNYNQVGAVPPTGYPNGVTIGVEGDTADGASQYSIGTTLPSGSSRIVFTPQIEQTGTAHVIVDAGSAVTGVDFGATRVSLAAFAEGDAHPAHGAMMYAASSALDGAVEHGLLV